MAKVTDLSTITAPADASSYYVAEGGVDKRIVHSALSADIRGDLTSANIIAAGGLADSEVTDLAGIKALVTSTLQVKPSEGAFANGDKTKLNSIDSNADVTLTELAALAATATVTSSDKALIQDADDADNIKTVTAQSIANLGIQRAYSEWSDSGTLALTDAVKFVGLNNAAAKTITVPPNSGVAFPVGTEIPIIQVGEGSVTVVAGSGVTINTPDNLLLQRQYAQGLLRKTATDTWAFIRYWLQAEAPPISESDPDVNTPAGHWANVKFNRTFTEADYDQNMVDLLGVTGIQGVTRRWLIGDLDTGTFSAGDKTDASYDFTPVINACALAYANGGRILVFPMFKSFEDVHQVAPPWMLASTGGPGQYFSTDNPTGLYEANNAGGYSLRIHTAIGSAYLIDFYSALAAALDGKPGFAGVVVQESAIGYLPTSGTQGSKPISAGEQTVFIDTLRTVAENLATDLPAYNNVWFCNHLNQTGSVETGKFYAAVNTAFTNISPQTNLIIAGPDLFPHSSDLEYDNSTNNDRIYTVLKNLRINDSTIRFGSSLQFDSYAVNTASLPSAATGAWPVPPEVDSVGSTLWPVEDIFLHGREELEIEFCFWSDRATGAQTFDPNAKNVISAYPSFERTTNLFPAGMERDPQVSAGWDVNTGITVAEDTTNRNGHETKVSGQASWIWTETATTGLHDIEYAFAATSIEVNRMYTMEICCKRVSGANDRDMTLTVRRCTDTAGAQFAQARFEFLDDPNDPFPEQNNLVAARYQEMSNGFYKIQMDFIPRPLATDLTACDVRYQMSIASAESYTGLASAELICHDMKFYKTARDVYVSPPV